MVIGKHQYGYIIGQINEAPGLPKYLPSFLILYLSVMIEIVALFFWNNEDFKMYDPTKEAIVVAPVQAKAVSTNSINKVDLPEFPALRHLKEMDSPGPGSLSGSFRLNKATGLALRDLISSDDLSRKLKSLETNDTQDESLTIEEKIQPVEPVQSAHKGSSLNSMIEYETNTTVQNRDKERQHKNLQVTLFKMILGEDRRMIKYLVLFTMYGMLISPINFLFLSMEEVCRKDPSKCNFSNLAGSVLISQASIETLAFFVMPWFLKFMSRPLMFTCGLIMMASRNFFYAGFYYTAGISPYWALIAEWGHGISYGIFATLLADVALMFANQCELFIPHLRRSGFISQIGTVSSDKIRAEEVAIKMALRATMQAIYGGVMDGLGQGAGCLVSGIVYDVYGYITLWQLFTIIAISTCVIHQLVEATRSRFSDNPRQSLKNLNQSQLSGITLDNINDKSSKIDGLGQSKIQTVE